MGLSLVSALVGLGLVVIGIVLLALKKPRMVAIFLMVLGFALIVLPGSIIYIFFN